MGDLHGRRSQDARTEGRALKPLAHQTSRLGGILGIRRGDTIAYELSGDQVVLRRGAKDDAGDPALLGFLDLLERDIAAHPDRLKPVPEDLVHRARDLVHGVEVDLDAPL